MTMLMRIILLVLAMAATAMAANSSSECDGGVLEGYNNQVLRITCDFTADDATGAYDTVTFDTYGYLIKVVTNPGSPAPTDNYDIAITEENGANICSTNLDNRDTANSEQALCVSGNPVWLSGVHTITITNNSVNSAVTELTLWVKRKE